MNLASHWRTRGRCLAARERHDGTTAPLLPRRLAGRFLGRKGTDPRDRESDEHGIYSLTWLAWQAWQPGCAIVAR